MNHSNLLTSPIQASTSLEKSVSTSGRRVELDFLRGIAILLALGWHFNGKDTGIYIIDLFLIPGRTIGWAGVDLFFVLSGYLVGGLIFSELKNKETFDGKRFLIRRAFKIWPVLYTYIALLVIIGRYPAMDIVPQTLLHLQNYFTTPLHHLWSLAVEEHFYIVFTIAIVLSINKIKAQPNAVPIALKIIMGLALGARIVGFLLDSNPVDIQIQTQYRIDALACGVLLTWTRIYKPDLYINITQRKILLFLLLVIFVAAVIVTQQIKETRSTVCYSFTYLGGACFLLLLENLPNKVGRGILFKAIAKIGIYSYAMYIFQFFGVRIAEAAWHKFIGTEMPRLIELCAEYGGALITAVVITVLLERPVLNLRNRLFPT